jgi:hypothetical protein
MKTAFSGDRYDTTKADLIGEAFNDVSNFERWRAKLYRTPRAGKYFLAGEGGWLTRWKGGEGIIPVSEKEARAWAKRYLR